MKKVDHKTINNLLKPLRLYVIHGVLFWHIKNIYGDQTLLLYESTSPCYTTSGSYTDLSHLLRSLCRADRIVMGDSITDAKIVNPYFGCNSLHEMLVKRDLVLA